jgi:hypothetical protein
MNFFQRLKKDHKFRMKAIIFFVVAVLLIGNMTEDKKGFQDPAVCNGIIPTGLGANNCEAQECMRIL